MKPKQARFVAEYRKDLNATAAAVRAGYHPKMAAALLANPSISAAVAEKTQQQLDKADITAERVLKELSRLAFSDVSRLFDEQGNLKPIHTLSPEDSACIAGLEVIIKNAEAGDGHTDKVHKIKIWDKSKNLEMLAKHFALLTERIEHSGGLVLKWQD